MSRTEDSAARFLPPRLSLPALRDAAAGCTACPLHETGTQTVFGEGPQTASLVFVGEQPGDEEDLAGHPFVGPAGRLLDKLLVQAGIDRSGVFVTNAVKHFKWSKTVGKRRLHQKPAPGEIRACRPWLDAELAVIKPRVLVALGATAAQALLGSGFRVTKQRGEWVASDLAPHVMATVHPSSLLRIPEAEERRAARARFVEELGEIARKM